MVKRITVGVTVDESSLALDVIDQVGPGGEYVGIERTFKHFREVWYTTLFDRTRSVPGMDTQTEPVRDRLRRTTTHILETHRPAPLASEIVADVDKREKE